MTNRRYRWHEIYEVARILGIVSDDDSTEQSEPKFDLSKILKKRIELGLVGKKKHGTARNAKAEYWFIETPTRDEPHQSVFVEMPTD